MTTFTFSTDNLIKSFFFSTEMYCGAFCTNQRKSTLIFYRFSFLLYTCFFFFFYLIVPQFNTKTCCIYTKIRTSSHISIHWEANLLIIKTSRDLKLFIRECFTISQNSNKQLYHLKPWIRWHLHLRTCLCKHITHTRTHVGWSTKVHKTKTMCKLKVKEKDCLTLFFKGNLVSAA